MKISRISLLAAAAMTWAVAAPALAPKSVRDGIAAWQRADYKTAVSIWQPLAEKGDADAAFNLGQAHRLGRGVTVDLAAAQKWLQLAARKGHLEAQTTLGLLLFDSGNREQALQWLEKAAERGEPRAMLLYGTALFNGDGVERDELLAYVYVSRAAAQGLEPAKSTLAELDRLLPVDVRRRGVEIALAKAAAQPSTGASSAPRPVAPAAKTAPQTVAASERATPVQSVATVAGAWRIQLGAFSRRSSAEQLYAEVAANPALAGRKPFYVPAGAVTRLQIGPFPSRAAATAACSALKSRACFPVESK